MYARCEFARYRLDEYKAMLRKQREQAAQSTQLHNGSSSDSEPAPLETAGDAVGNGHIHETPCAGNTDAESAAAEAADRRSYIDWDTMQQM